MLFSSRIKAWIEDESSNAWMVRRLVSEYGRQHWKHYGASFATGMVAAGCTALTAYLVGSVVNQAYLDRNFFGIAWLSVVIIGLFTAKGLAVYGNAVILAWIGNRITVDLQRKLFDKILSEGMAFFSRRHSMDLLARATNGASAAAGALQTIITALGRDIMTLIGLLTVMVIQEPVLSLIGFVVMPVAVLSVRNLIKRTKELAQSEFKADVGIRQLIQETLRGLRIVKAFTLEEELQHRIQTTISAVEQKRNKLARLRNRSTPMMESLGGIAIALVLLYGGYSVLELGAKPGAFVSFITAFLLAYEPAKRIARLNVNLTQSLIAVRRMIEILDSPPTEPLEPEHAPFPIKKGEIRFKNVQFEYHPGEPVLNDVSFVAEGGRLTALVGPSGSGKSTVASMILRLYDPQAGTIEIDGIDVAAVPRRSIRRQIAYVGQDVFLFSGSIRENIAYGKLGATEEEIVNAAKAAFAHDFIMSLPDGYDTEVGEAGARLSGGERQRIAVARALIRDARIILLDEATSSLDSASEREVQMAIDRLREGRTCVAIAHRLHTIMNADSIYVLDRGRIVESGSHTVLMNRNSRYAELFRMLVREERNSPAETPQGELLTGS